MTEEALSSVHTRPSLLFRLKDWQDSSSWAEFYQIYRKLVVRMALSSGLSDAEAEEVAQKVFKHVAETIHDFEANPQRGSFRGWLMNLTRWYISDREHSAAEGDGYVHRDPSSDQYATIGSIAAPTEADAEWEAAWRPHILDAALNRVAKSARATHFQVFDLHARKKWPVMQVAQELGVNPIYVYFISRRLDKQLAREIRKLKAQLQ